MKSKLLMGALCVAALLLVAPEAEAQVETGRIARNVSKSWTFTTDTSTIFQIQVIAFHKNTDIDILVTVPDRGDEEPGGDDDPTTDNDDEVDVVLDSRSGINQLEQGSVGLLGATEVTVTITNVDGPHSRFALLITQPALDASARLGAMSTLTYVGEFGPDDRVSEPRLRAVQSLAAKQIAAKR